MQKHPTLSLVEHFKDLPDPRLDRTKDHALNLRSGESPMDEEPGSGHSGGDESAMPWVGDSRSPGDPVVPEGLLPLVYDELRRLARAQLSRESAQQTLQPTALVREAWLKLVGENHAWANREHFFRVAGEAMRRILIDRARRRHRLKRGPNLERVPIEELDIALVFDDDRLLRVNEALDRLAVEDPLKAELVKLRFFVGLRRTLALNFCPRNWFAAEPSR